jgi:hypothetical protein
MLKDQTNQDFKDIVSLMGQKVSFISSLKVQDEFYTKEIKGTVTDISLSLSGKCSISFDGGDYFLLSELLEFKILDSDPVGDAFEALITDNKDFIDSLSKPTL